MQLQDALQLLLPQCADPPGSADGTGSSVVGGAADGGVELASSKEGRFRSRDWASSDVNKHRWRGLALYEACTARVRVAFSRANREHFASMDGPVKKVRSATWNRTRPSEPRLYLAITGLLSLRARLLADIVVRVKDGDVHAQNLAIPDHSLVALDADVASPTVLLALHHRADNRHFLAPVADRRKWRTAQMLDQRTGDCLVEMRVPPSLAREMDLPPYVLWRLVPYHRHGYPPQVLLTSLLDPSEFPRHELSAIHSERWLWNAGSGRPSTGKQAAIADSHPPAVLDRLWTALWWYNLLRSALAEGADALGEEPARMDFAEAVARVGRDNLLAALAAGDPEPLASALGAGASDLAALVRTEPPSPVQLKVDPL